CPRVNDADRARAFELLSKVPTLAERGGAALGWLARRRLTRALAAFRDGAAADPADAMARLGLGRALHVAGELDEAVRVLEAPPLGPEAHHELAAIAASSWWASG